MLKPLLIIIGTLSLLLGIIGVVVPGLPTTPFLLLSATLYVRSSKRLYYWLITHKFLGKYIRKYRKHGLTAKTLIYAILLMWVMISISTIYFINASWLKIILISLGLIGTIVMYFVHRKKHKQ